MEAVKFNEPTTNAQFVAFTPPTRVEGPDGSALTAGSQTLVQYFRGIKVEKIIDGGYGATKGRDKKVNPEDVKTVRVEFDPESVGLDHPIAGNIAPSDPQLDVLRHAYDADEAVNIAIETIRKAKNSETKAPISPLTPIYALTGASEPGGKGRLDDAKQTVTKVIASVNGITTADCRSDATQWQSLQGNKAGTLPPEGFRFLSDKEDWKAYGVIVPEEGYTPQGGNSTSNVDFRAMAEYIINQVVEKVNTSVPANNGGGYMRRTPSDDQIGEGRPYDVRNLRGDINLGSYVASKYHFTYTWAWKYLRDQMQSTPDQDAVTNLTQIILALAGRVQVGAYGDQHKVDPSVNSHTLATRWVEWVIEEQIPYTFDGEVPQEWKDQVAQAAIRYMKDSGEWVDSAFRATNAVPQKQEKKQAESAPATDQNAQQPKVGNRMERLNACLNAVNNKFDDAGALRAIYAKAKEESLLGAPVAYVDNKVIFQDGSDLTLDELIVRRGKRLMENAEKSASVQNDVDPAPAPVDEPAEDASQSADTEDGIMSPEEFAAAIDASFEDDSVPVSEETGPAAEDFADDAPDSEGSDLGSLIEGIKDRSVAGVEWNKARDNDRLNDTITVNGEETTVKEAFEALSKKFEEADGFVEQIVEVDDPQDLTPLRQKAKRADVLDLLVSDGVSDEEKPLDDVIKQTRAKLKANNG